MAFSCGSDEGIWDTLLISCMSVWSLFIVVEKSYLGSVFRI